MKLIDLSKILRPFKSGWVALSMDYKKVLGWGKTLQAARKRAEKTGEEFSFYKIESAPTIHVPYTLIK
ncbi:MAG: hypothetical protein UY21_C0024G0009 [Microgenomates group bacterium GW2011_GWA1_48_10]|nr:MAG: hypothetical protein UY21_C0024G0009 [Microgenomates group bacterium GW2011_GWA1_48_10]